MIVGILILQAYILWALILGEVLTAWTHLMSNAVGVTGDGCHQKIYQD